MQPILWIAFYMTVWSALAVWTVIRARGIGSPFRSEPQSLRPVAATTGLRHGTSSRQS